MTRYPGITYDGGGYPLTLSDWRAQHHLDEQAGRRCFRPCPLCEWVAKWKAWQERNRPG